MADDDWGFRMNVVGVSKPVIAPNEGGYKESVVDKVTGRLINDIDHDKIVDAVKEIGKNPEKYKDECLKQVKKFDVGVFIKTTKATNKLIPSIML